MANHIKFQKVNSLPVTLTADTLYLYKDTDDRLLMALTDNTGSIIYTTNNKASINTLISTYVASVKGQNNGIAGLDNTGKVPLTNLAEVLAVTDLSTYNATSGSGDTALRSTITSPANGDLLTYSGGNWINQPPTSNKVLNVYNVDVSGQPSGTTTMPQSNTKPAISNGTEVAAITLTPVSASSKFAIQFNALLTHNAGGARGVAAALFRDSTFLAIGGVWDVAGYYSHSGIHCSDAPATVSSIKYSIRVGISSSGTWYVGKTGSATFGGSNKQSLIIIEYQ